MRNCVTTIIDNSSKSKNIHFSSIIFKKEIINKKNIASKTKKKNHTTDTNNGMVQVINTQNNDQVAAGKNNNIMTHTHHTCQSHSMPNQTSIEPTVINRASNSCPNANTVLIHCNNFVKIIMDDKHKVVITVLMVSILMIMIQYILVLKNKEEIIVHFD